MENRYFYEPILDSRRYRYYQNITEKVVSEKEITYELHF